MVHGDLQSDRSISPVEIRLTIERFGKPPLVELRGEIISRNNRLEPCWFLIPEALPSTSKGGVYRIEVSEIEGSHSGVLAGLFGTESVWALLLPPGGEARITGLPIQYWGELPKSINVSIRMAREVTLQGKPLPQWFGMQAMNQAQVDGVYPEQGRGRLATLRLPNDKESALVLTDEQVISVSALVQTHEPGRQR